MMIDPATQADAKAIAQIHRAARQAAMPWLPSLHSAADDLHYFSTQVLPIQHVLMAREAGRAIGFIACHDEWLNHLYIVPSRWRRGIGARLLAAARADLTYLQLWVFQDNMAAQQFYAKHGFTLREVTDGQTNEEKTPDARMDWRR